MPAPLRLAAAALAGAALAAAVALRVVPIEPSLAFSTHWNPLPQDGSWYTVRVELRGGEPMESVEALPGSPGVRVFGQPAFRDVPPERGLRFQVTADAAAPRPHRLRVIQRGRVERTYDVVLEASK